MWKSGIGAACAVMSPGASRRPRPEEAEIRAIDVRADAN